MDKLMGRGGVGKGYLRTRGLTVEAHDEWTPIITWHAPAIETLVHDIFQPLDFREVTKDLTH
jgi:hypothetical protein